jgi:hypothetical protein
MKSYFPILTFILLALSLSAKAEDYDRLDGTGASGIKVQVIEWEGNLEIHSYPKGQLKKLAMKLDHKDKNKLVMVIGYRFKKNPKQQLVRRAILGIDLKDGFKTFKDDSEDEFDKIIVSNNTLSDQVVAYQLEPGPKSLYPAEVTDEDKALLAAQQAKKASRQPAAGTETADADSAQKDTSDSDRAQDQEDGRIRPFFMQQK